MWPHILTVGVGIWLMAAPTVLGYVGAARTSHHIVGPIIATLAWVAAAECTRGVRHGNLPLAAWLLVSPLLVDHATAATLNSVASGVVVAIFARLGGRTRARFGGGWRALR